MTRPSAPVSVKFMSATTSLTGIIAFRLRCAEISPRNTHTAPRPAEPFTVASFFLGLRRFVDGIGIREREVVRAPSLLAGKRRKKEEHRDDANHAHGGFLG